MTLDNSQNPNELELSDDRKEAEVVHEDMPFAVSGEVFNLAFLDDGHGLWDTAGKRTPYIQELGRNIRENEFNQAVVNQIASKLRPLGIIPILVSPGDKDTPLKARTDFANKTYKSYQDKYGKAFVKAIYVSVHYDAMSHVWHDAEGITLFVYNGNLNTNSGKLAAAIGSFLRLGTKQQYRGIKQQNFHVLRETNMPAVLTENGFMSNKWEAMLMLNKAFQTEVATEHSRGIAKYFNVAYRDNAGTPTTPGGAADVTSGGTKHKIVKGDTYTSLAEHYGVSIDAITKANPGINPTNLQIGQSINIPSSGGSKHIIVKGDTYSSLAERYGVSIDAITKANPGINPTTLQIGQSINIPSKTSTSKTPSTTTAKPAPTPAPKPTARTINGIKILGDIQIINVKNAAYICDKPSTNSKNLATIGLGKKLPISGSLPDWWEVVYGGKRCYVNTKYGKLL